MKKPNKPRKPKAPEKPLEYFESKDYTYCMGNYDYSTLEDAYAGLGLNIKDVHKHTIAFNVEISNFHGCYENDSYIKITIPEKHKNPNYETELKVYNRALTKYEKDLEDYPNKLDKYKEKLQAYEQWKVELQSEEKQKAIAEAKKLLKEAGEL